MLYQLSYASMKICRKTGFLDVKSAGTPAPAAFAAQNLRLAQGPGWGKPASVNPVDVPFYPLIRSL